MRATEDAIIYATYGTAALKACRPQGLRVIEGGLSKGSAERKAVGSAVTPTPLACSGATEGPGASAGTFQESAPSAAQAKAWSRALLAVILLSVVVAFGAWWALRAQQAEVLTNALSSVSSESVSVASGDTLLAIAEQHPIEGLSAQQTARWIVDQNGLEDSSLSIGQILLVPASSAD